MNFLFYIRNLAIRLGAVLLLFLLLRIFFVWRNADLFADLSNPEFLRTLWFGLRFDLAGVLSVNVLLIFFSILPLPFRNARSFRNFLKFLFVVVNTTALILLFVDVEYYRFTRAHSHAQIVGIAPELTHLGATFLVDFWYIFLLFIASVVFLFKTFTITNTVPQDQPSAGGQWLLFPLVMGFTLLGMRGGFQTKPLSPIHASEHVAPGHVDLVLNSVYTFLHSLGHRDRQLTFMSGQELKQHFDFSEPIAIDDSLGFPRKAGKNVLIIVMESLSQAYSELYGAEHGLTPFMDSLGRNSMVFMDMNANGFTSTDGLAALLAGIPNMGEESFLFGSHQANQVEGLGNILKKHGYQTAFFHGGINGTLNFDKFSKAAGFDQYFGKDEFGDDSQFDGNWGISDLPFFQFTVDQLSETQQPFCGVLFSLSSHHPWKLPPSHKNAFDDEADDVDKLVRYADESLRALFAKAKKEKWYQNTLFIITADHKGPTRDKYFDHHPGRFQIPLIVHFPGDTLHRTFTHPVQQIDLLPGVVALLDLHDTLNHFGQGLFESTHHYIYQQAGNHHFISDEQFLLRSDLGDDQKLFYLERGFSEGSQQRSARSRIGKTCGDSIAYRRLLDRLHAMVQQYDLAMKHNMLKFSRENLGP